MSDKYILVDGVPQPCDDLMEWGKWMQTGDRIVAKTVEGDAEVSTVFLGLDHSFGNGVPLLYETMIFGGKHDQYQDRYATREEAELGHASVVAMLRGGF